MVQATTGLFFLAALVGATGILASTVRSDRRLIRAALGFGEAGAPRRTVAARA
jgi:hypothetical protein